MKLKLRILFLAIICACSFTSCYRMPTDDDYSLLPSTNNPTVTRQRSDPLTPQVAY